MDLLRVQGTLKSLLQHHNSEASSVLWLSVFFGVPRWLRIKYLPAMQEAPVQSLGQEDPLEKGMATHSSILTWKTERTEEPSGPQSMGSQRVGHD